MSSRGDRLRVYCNPVFLCRIFGCIKTSSLHLYRLWSFVKFVRLVSWHRYYDNLLLSWNLSITDNHSKSIGHIIKFFNTDIPSIRRYLYYGQFRNNHPFIKQRRFLSLRGHLGNDLVFCRWFRRRWLSCLSIGRRLDCCWLFHVLLSRFLSGILSMRKVFRLRLCWFLDRLDIDFCNFGPGWGYFFICSFSMQKQSVLYTKDYQ